MPPRCRVSQLVRRTTLILLWVILLLTVVWPSNAQSETAAQTAVATTNIATEDPITAVATDTQTLADDPPTTAGAATTAIQPSTVVTQASLTTNAETPTTATNPPTTTQLDDDVVSTPLPPGPTPEPPPTDTEFIPTETPRPALFKTPAPTPAPTQVPNITEDPMALKFDTSRTISFMQVLEEKEKVAEFWWVQLLSLLFVIMLCLIISHIRRRVEAHRTSMSFFVYRAVAKNIAVVGLCAATVNTISTAVTEHNQLWGFLLYSSYLTLFVMSVILMVKLCLVIYRSATFVDEWAAWEVHLPRDATETHSTSSISASLHFVNDVRYVFLHQLHFIFPHRAVLEQDIRATSYIQKLQSRLMLELVSLHWKNWAGVGVFVLLNCMRQIAVMHDLPEVNTQVQIDDAATYVFALGYIPAIIYMVYHRFMLKQCREYLSKARQEVKDLHKERERNTYDRAVKEYHEAMFMAEFADAKEQIGSARHNILKQKALMNYRPSSRELAIQSRLEPAMKKTDFLDSFQFLWFKNPAIAVLTFRGCVLVNSFYLAYLITSGIVSMMLTEIAFGAFFFFMSIVPSLVVFYHLPLSSLVLIMATSLGPYIHDDVATPMVFLDTTKEALPSRVLRERKKAKRRLLLGAESPEGGSPKGDGSALEVPLLDQSASEASSPTASPTTRQRRGSIMDSFKTRLSSIKDTLSKPGPDDGGKAKEQELSALKRAEEMNIDNILDALEDVDDDLNDEVLHIMRKAQGLPESGGEVDAARKAGGSQVEEIAKQRILNPLMREPIHIGDLVKGPDVGGEASPAAESKKQESAGDRLSAQNAALVDALKDHLEEKREREARGEVEMPELRTVQNEANTMTDLDFAELNHLLDEVVKKGQSEEGASQHVDGSVPPTPSSPREKGSPANSWQPSARAASPASGSMSPSQQQPATTGNSSALPPLKELPPHQLEALYLKNLEKVIRCTHRLKLESEELHEKIIEEATVRRIQENKFNELVQVLARRPDLRPEWEQRMTQQKQAEALLKARGEVSRRSRMTTSEKLKKKKEQSILRKVQTERHRDQFGGLTASSFQQDGFYFGDWEGANGSISSDDSDDRLAMVTQRQPTADDILDSLLSGEENFKSLRETREEKENPAIGALKGNASKEHMMLPQRTVPQLPLGFSAALQRHMSHAIANPVTVDYGEIARAQEREEKRLAREMARAKRQAEKLKAKRDRYLEAKRKKKEDEELKRMAQEVQTVGGATAILNKDDAASSRTNPQGAAASPTISKAPSSVAGSSSIMQTKISLPGSNIAPTDDPFADTSYRGDDFDDGSASPTIDVVATAPQLPDLDVDQQTPGTSLPSLQKHRRHSFDGSSFNSSDFGSSFDSNISDSSNSSLETPSEVSSSDISDGYGGRIAKPDAEDRRRRRSRYQTVMTEKKHRYLNRERKKRRGELDFSSWGVEEMYVSDLAALRKAEMHL